MNHSESEDAAVELVIVPRTRDLGDGFEVRRALPAIERRMVGPFVFLDQMGPATLEPGHGLDVRPHPHICLATVTYLFEGSLMHRDSLGSVQRIMPGEINLMSAGRGIVHSERTPPEERQGGARLHGVQSWLALPRSHEESEPAFDHYGAVQLPIIEREGLRIRLLIGRLEGAISPVRTFSETLYADLALEPGARFELPRDPEERALYIVEGSLELDGREHAAGELVVLRPRAAAALVATGSSAARLRLLGGAPLDGPRHIWWNFVASSRERIDQAKRDWAEGHFGKVPGETEFIPLPGGPPPPVDYP